MKSSNRRLARLLVAACALGLAFGPGLVGCDDGSSSTLPRKDTAEGDGIDADVGTDTPEDIADAPDGTDTAALCTNGMRDGDETDVDCGGSCDPCADGSACEISGDCESTICSTDGRCVAFDCDDVVQNADETDVDCGGPDCDPCADGDSCVENSDCESNICDANVCIGMACMNGSQDGSETDVDCGGEDCAPCADGASCMAASDCESGICSNGTCAAFDCMDGTQNGSETDVDCGGADCDACPDDAACVANSDCESGVCSNDVCAAAACDDGVINGNETDTDCGGGDCPACSNSSACLANSDCESMICENDTCIGFDCSDGTQNGSETDVDCGGPDCPTCADGASCVDPTDCTSGICSSNTCVASDCSDGMTNGDETDVDCGGGTCPACPNSSACLQSSDCQSGICSGGFCVNTDCTNGTQDGNETDVDCGGGDCGPCAIDDSCMQASDCQSGICTGNVCVASDCTDGIQNGDETDVDCGGTACSQCSVGQSCVADSDCSSGTCFNGTCESYTSCSDILDSGASTGDGVYTIDPDGPSGSTFAPMDVQCDMTSAGGGWTCIDPVTADTQFGFTITDLGLAGVCQVNNSMPEGKTTAGLGCRFDVDLGFTFDEIRTDSVVIEAYAGGGANSDLTFVDDVWGTNACSGEGDVRFGSPAHGEPSLTLGAFNNVDACGAGGNFNDGVALNWDADQAPATRDSVLRLEFGEAGGADEGWRWASGCVMVRERNTVQLAGGLTEADPTSWEDGTYAESCDGYRNPTLPYEYVGATGDGYYEIDPSGSGSPVTVFCDMTTDGGGWTCIEPSTADTLFGFTTTDLSGNGGCLVNAAGQPQGKFPGLVSCRYDLDVGFDFDTVRTSNLVIEAYTGGGGHTTDLTVVDGDWGTTTCGSRGDVFFGTAAHSRGVLSLGDAIGPVDPCGAVQSYSDATLITWDGAAANTARDSVLRLEFGEDGGQDEGWRWKSGCLLVRDEGTVQISGALTQVDPGQWEDGTFASSCAEYRRPTQAGYVYAGSVGDGFYSIDPDADGIPTIVNCDMTSQGGGWTCVNPAAANALGWSVSDGSLGGAGSVCSTSDSLEGLTVDDLQCTYDIDLGFDYNAIRMDSVEIEALADAAVATELAFVDGPWGTIYCGSPDNSGDVVWGSTTHPGGVLSLAEFNGSTGCSDFTNHTNGEILVWDGVEKNTTLDSTLRLEFGEEGGDNEGWHWTAGCVQVREEIPIAGALTAADPGHYADGTYARSCDAYRHPTDLHGYLGSTGDGIYTIDPDGPFGGAAPRDVYCDMTTDGGGWTRIAMWDRENGTDDLASFRSMMTQDFDNMGQFEDKGTAGSGGYIRWSDADSTFDAMAYRRNTSIPNSGELRLDVHFEGISNEQSGVWFFATAGGTEQNILCWDDVSGDPAYDPATEQVWIPSDYTCPNNDPALSTVTWDWTRTEQVNLSGAITSFHIHGLQGDCCVDGGDSSDLYYFYVYIR